MLRLDQALGDSPADRAHRDEFFFASPDEAGKFAAVNKLISARSAAAAPAHVFAEVAVIGGMIAASRRFDMPQNIFLQIAVRLGRSAERIRPEDYVGPTLARLPA